MATPEPAGASADAKNWLAPLIKPLRPAFREVLWVSLFVNILALGLPIFVLQVYDRVVFYQGFSTLYGLTAGILIVLLFDFILRQARSRILQRAAMLIDVKLGERLYDKIGALPLRSLETRPTSFWLALYRDSDIVRNVFSGPTAVLATELPFVGLFLVLIFVIAAPVAWVLAVVAPLFMLLAWGSGKVMDRATLRERESGQGREALVAELLAGRTTVKALALAPAVRPRWEDKHAAAIQHALERGRKGDSFTNLGTSAAFLTTVAMTTVGAIAIVGQELTIGSLIAANMLSNRVLQPLNQLVNTWRQVAQYRQAKQRLGTVFALPEDDRAAPVELGRPKGELALEDVTFAYQPGARPVVDGVRMTIRPGGMVGVIGPNGCGKTTLVKLMHGLYPPAAGRILLDGADIAQFSRAQIARWIGYVPQDAILFSGSIRDNIAMAAPGVDDAALVRAAKLAGVHAFVVDLPEGYATDIGEAGMRMSGGERQRIAVARALVHDPPVLLLDEVASNLDRQAELALRDSLVKLAPERTIVVVCHTPVLLSACSHIVVMDKGKIALAGPSREVMPKLFGQPRPEAVQEAKA
ncbi:MAG: peptidase domain-containing ABC transporter [Alphaproteobacteria bacterium]